MTPKNSRVLPLFLFIVISLCVLEVHNEECSSGMRKTFITSSNTYGYGISRRTTPLYLTYSSGSAGALWFHRWFLTDPRFEVHLKISTTAQSTSKKLDGFAIVISTSAFKIGSGYSNLGYSGFTNLYVLETDFYQNTRDISANTMSLP